VLEEEVRHEHKLVLDDSLVVEHGGGGPLAVHISTLSFSRFATSTGGDTVSGSPMSGACPSRRC